MNRDEYLALLETESLTPNQRGAIMGEFGRLGFHHLRHRAERLAVCAALLGIDDLGSTADLTQGQAGQLLNILRHTTDRTALLQAAAVPAADGKPAVEHRGQDRDGEPVAPATAVSEQVTWPEVFIWIVAAIWAAVRRGTDPSAPEREGMKIGDLRGRHGGSE